MSNSLIEISKCEVCGSDKDLSRVLDLGMHPMCDDLVEVGSSRICKEYPIDIWYCDNCYTAHQKYQIPKTELFPTTYHYRARFTADVLNGMKGLVEDIEQFAGKLNGKTVLDIGCNDGSLLNFFKEKGAKTFGIEPTGAYSDAAGNGHTVLNRYFSVSSAEEFLQNSGQPDIVTFTNVFAHIEDLGEIIDALKILFHEKSILVIENHYLGAVFDKMQFDTFYHEHPRTYSYRSFTYIAKSLGLDLLDVRFPSRYGGNIRVIIGNKEHYQSVNFDDKAILQKEANFKVRFDEMNNIINTWKPAMQIKLQEKKSVFGPLKAKAFPGRAAILVKLLGLDNELISAAYEKPGSLKIGYYLPGTRIPIKSDDELLPNVNKEKVLVNLAWHISAEIEKYLRVNNFEGELINIL